MKKYLYLIFILFLTACGGTKEIKDGSVAYDLKNFQLAKELLQSEINSANNQADKTTKLLQLADAYMQTNQAAQAIPFFEQAIEESGSYDYYYDLAMAQKRDEQYEEALKSLETYQEFTFDTYRATPEISICKKVLKDIDGKTNLFVTAIESINSPQADYASRLDKEGNIIFSSNRNTATGDAHHTWTGQKDDDLFLAKAKGDDYFAPENYDEVLNTEHVEGVATFSPNFKKIYFTRCDFTEGVNGYCKIMMAEADGKYWYEAEPIAIFGDSVNVGQPFMNTTGDRLYFSSDADFGFGGRDIYFIQETDTGWSEPYNVGMAVNTDKDELFPTLDSQGNLYFSSNGRTGYGGLDIFKAIPVNNSYGKTEHLPYPINSGADDFSFQWIKEYDGTDENGILEKAIFTSARKGGKGFDDIYLYEKKYLNYYTLTLDVVEKKYKTPDDSESEILGLQPLEGAEVTISSNTSLTKEDGQLKYNLNANTDYKIFVSKNGYFNQSITVSTKGLTSVEELYIQLYEQVELEKIFPEKEIVIPNIYYDYDKATLRPESKLVLDTLVSFFEENNDLTIEIGSHTDSRGSDKYNEDLSQRRAQSVVDYFIEKGVPSPQLQAKGYGESKITNRCTNGVTCSEEEHQANRRTTFRVVSSNGILKSE